VRRRLLITLGWLVLATPAAAAPAAPAFTITLLEGSGHFDSRAQIGKQVLVVRFQASWCKVCNEEAMGMERLYQKYRTRGVELVSVQVQDTEDDARNFLKVNKATYPAGLDPRLKIANRFGFRGTPYTVVVNKRGEIVARIHGRADEARLSRILDPLVKPAPARKPPARLPIGAGAPGPGARPVRRGGERRRGRVPSSPARRRGRRPRSSPAGPRK